MPCTMIQQQSISQIRSIPCPRHRAFLYDVSQKRTQNIHDKIEGDAELMALVLLNAQQAVKLILPNKLIE